jgi:hypothetical protein
MNLPAAAGVAAQHSGLRTATHAYAIAVALLAVAAVAALTVSRVGRPATHTTTFRDETQRTD